MEIIISRPVLVALNTIVNVLTEQFDSLEGAIKVIQSDARLTRNMVAGLTGRDVVYDKPEDESEKPPKAAADKFLKWFVDKVAPGLVQALIISFITAFTLLVVLNFAELQGIGL